LGYFYVV
jgi:acyl-CoA-binding protein